MIKSSLSGALEQHYRTCCPWYIGCTPVAVTLTPRSKYTLIDTPSLPQAQQGENERILHTQRQCNHYMTILRYLGILRAQVVDDGCSQCKRIPTRWCLSSGVFEAARPFGLGHGARTRWVLRGIAVCTCTCQKSKPLHTFLAGQPTELPFIFFTQLPSHHILTNCISMDVVASFYTFSLW